MVLATGSGPHQTILDIQIHGFYFYDLVRQGQVFRRITLDRRPDGARFRALGRPELPALHHTLGNLVGGSVAAPVIQVLDQVVVPGPPVYPTQPEQRVNDPPVPFLWDQAFYQQTTQPYPGVPGEALGSLGRFGGLDLLGAETYPLRAIPATQQLLVLRHYRATIAHSGSATPISLGVTRRQQHQYEGLLDNYGAVTPFRPVLVDGYAGDYLIVTPGGFLAEIEPLAEQKRRRGYIVTVATTEDIGSTCDDIRSYIADWWGGGDPERDHYALLVGDDGWIPACEDENGRWSDRLYACVDGLAEDGLPDVFPEVRLGRLTVINDAECTDMVDKILAYEDSYPGWFTGQTLLVAHEQADPSFELLQESIRTAAYSVPPTFETIYGSVAESDDDAVRTSIEAGKGIVCYSGHGNSVAWVGWDGQDFDKADVELLDNDDRLPVVLAMTCSNNRFTLDTPDGIGETWMKTTERAAAHYGSTDVVWYGNIDALGQSIFEEIYDVGGIVLLGDALMYAESKVIERFEDDQVGEEDIWTFLLLGDPDLKVWREPPPLLAPVYEPGPLPVGAGQFEVRVSELPLAPSAGAAQPAGISRPVPSAIVSLYKPGEFASNRYTDSEGVAIVPISPASPGWIYITVYTDFGSHAVARDSVEVTNVVSVGDGAERFDGPRMEAAHPNPFRGSVSLQITLPGDGHVRLKVLDVSGREVVTLLEGDQRAGPRVVAWDGRDRAGRPAPPGLYLARLEFAGVGRVAKLVLAR